jgi:hypothetical protein
LHCEQHLQTRIGEEGLACITRRLGKEQQHLMMLNWKDALAWFSPPHDKLADANISSKSESMCPHYNHSCVSEILDLLAYGAC